MGPSGLLFTLRPPKKKPTQETALAGTSPAAPGVQHPGAMQMAARRSSPSRKEGRPEPRASRRVRIAAVAVPVAEGPLRVARRRARGHPLPSRGDVTGFEQIVKALLVHAPFSLPPRASSAPPKRKTVRPGDVPPAPTAGLESFRGESSLKTWLYAIALNRGARHGHGTLAPPCGALFVPSSRPRGP